MAEAVVLLTIVDKLLSLLGLIRAGEIKRDEKIEGALHSLNTALCETRDYVSRLNEGEESDRRHEHKLARLWSDASIPLRKIDPELASRCFMKGSYWMEPDAWDQARVKSNKIALDQVHESVRELLLG